MTSFRGYALDETNGVRFSTINDTPTMLGETEAKLAGGTARSRTSRGSRSLFADITITGTSSSNLEDRIKALMEELWNPSEGDLIVDTYKLPFTIARPGEIQYLAPLNESLMAVLPVLFESRSEWWQNPTSPVGSKTLTNNAASQESATMTYGADYAPSYPSFEITSLGASLITGYEVTLRNDSTGDELRLLDFDLGQDDVLEIDAVNEQVKVTNTTGNAKPPRRVDGVFWTIEGASITIIIKHNQIGLTPNFKVAWEIPANAYTLHK